jgi:uncharacterized protein GlcG (DUF336 family)
MHVTITEAEVAIDAARKRAAELGTQVCIAIVDSGANLKAFYRMDDAWVGSIDIAIKKAKTAVFFGMPTGSSASCRSRAAWADCVSRRSAHRRQRGRSDWRHWRQRKLRRE